jgi:hypothetical protein
MEEEKGMGKEVVGRWLLKLKKTTEKVIGKEGEKAFCCHKIVGKVIVVHIWKVIVVHIGKVILVHVIMDHNQMHTTLGWIVTFMLINVKRQATQLPCF